MVGRLYPLWCDMLAAKLKAPFPYFGGKSRVADLVWSRLGDVDNYIEPFCGSAAMLLRRPHKPRIETINDADCMVANFWRATQLAPEQVAEFADGPVNEADLHARHRWLVLSDEAKAFRERMRSDPDYFDPRIAGWWCWGLCCWIGGGWCTAHGETSDGERKQCMPILCPEKGVHAGGPREQVPLLSGDAGAAGRGVHASAGPRRRKVPAETAMSGKARIEGDNPGSYGKGVHAKGIDNRKPRIDGGEGQLGHGVHAKGRPQLADAYDIGRGVCSNGNAGTCAERRAWLLDWFGRLRDRLRVVRVCCGDWLRVCDSDSVTTRLGTTGIFFDPPYGDAADRDMNLYAVDCGKVAAKVRDYCLERGSDPRMRIILAGYAGEGHEALEAAGWEVIAWEAQGGYGNRSSKGKANAKRERLWVSPHCSSDTPLFEGFAS
jgi:hypothetical protein